MHFASEASSIEAEVEATTPLLHHVDETVSTIRTPTNYNAASGLPDFEKNVY